MSYKKVSIAAIALFFLVFSCTVSFGSEKGNKRSDTWLEAKLVTSYTLNEHLNPFKIEVEVDNGVAKISGMVDSTIERDLAVEIARGIEGINKVKENLTIEPQDKPGKENEFARQVDDATTTAKVKYRLMLNRNTDSLDINVDTEDNVVTLSGTVDSAEHKDLAFKLAQNTTGVKKVKDNLNVNAKKESSMEQTGAAVKKKMDEMSGSIQDTWITTKAKTVLFVSSEADGAEFDVSTANGTVTVTGTVLSEKQASEIGQVLADLQGVKNVDNKLKVK